MPFRRSTTPRPPLTDSELLDHALKSLGAKMKSERDLRRVLTPRAESAEAVDKVIAKLKELSYLSDERFAADFTRLRQENEKFGQRRVQQKLMQKGISQTLTAKTISSAYEDVDEVALARQYVERKRMKKPEGEKEIARVMRRLVTAGFSTSTVWKVLRAWDLDVDEVDVVEDEPTEA